MIVPDYYHQTWPLINNKESTTKCCCIYHEQNKTTRFIRYMTPTGWKHTCFWWNSKKEAQTAFENFGQTPLPIKDFEIQNNLEQKTNTKLFPI